MQNNDISIWIRTYIDKFRVILPFKSSRVPLCLAIIADEKSLPVKFGKRKQMECGKPLKKLDAFTMICPVGHKRKTIAWEKRSFAVFYGVKIKGSS